MINCCCNLGYDDEGPKVWNAVTRTARKPRQCCECASVIAPGQRYERADALHDHWGHWDTCLSCVAIWRDFFCGMRLMGELAGELEECHGLSLLGEVEG